MDFLDMDLMRTEEDVVKAVLNNSLPLKTSIVELDKVQAMLAVKIQALAANYHENILNHQNSLENLGSQIKTLQKKSENLHQKTVKLGKDLESNLEKMTNGIEKLEKVQKTSDIVRLLQTFCIKVKKTRGVDQKEIENLANELKGLNIVSKLMNRS
jgi:uncharacterized coiled-coil DUF342 family protein